MHTDKSRSKGFHKVSILNIRAEMHKKGRVWRYPEVVCGYVSHYIQGGREKYGNSVGEYM